jgi:hypothetical protein
MACSVAPRVRRPIRPKPDQTRVPPAPTDQPTRRPRRGCHESTAAVPPNEAATRCAFGSPATATGRTVLRPGESIRRSPPRIEALRKCLDPGVPFRRRRGDCGPAVGLRRLAPPAATCASLMLTRRGPAYPECVISQSHRGYWPCRGCPAACRHSGRTAVDDVRCGSRPVHRTIRSSSTYPHPPHGRQLSSTWATAPGRRLHHR